MWAGFTRSLSRHETERWALIWHAAKCSSMFINYTRPGSKCQCLQEDSHYSQKLSVSQKSILYIDIWPSDGLLPHSLSSSSRNISFTESLIIQSTAGNNVKRGCWLSALYSLPRWHSNPHRRPVDGDLHTPCTVCAPQMFAIFVKSPKISRTAAS